MPTSMSDGKLRIFVSYAHEDDDLRQELVNHLKTLEREEIISVWHDRLIQPGKDWDEEIDEEINSAHIILLLVSSYFMASDYCQGKEMSRALERSEAGEAIVIPVVLRHVDWTESSFANLQALPTDGRPVTDGTWTDKHEALANVTKGIRRRAVELRPLAEVEKPKSGTGKRGLPVVVIAMLQDEAKQLLQDASAGGMPYSALFGSSLNDQEADRIIQRYGKSSRNDWLVPVHAHSGPNNNDDTIRNVVERITEASVFKADFESDRFLPANGHPNIGLADILRDRWPIVLIDVLSLYHPRISSAVYQSGLATEMRASIVYINTLDPLITQKASLMRSVLQEQLQHSWYRYKDQNDPRCTIEVCDDCTLGRWFHVAWRFREQDIMDHVAREEKQAEVANSSLLQSTTDHSLLRNAHR